MELFAPEDLIKEDRNELKRTLTLIAHYCHSNGISEAPFLNTAALDGLITATYSEDKYIQFLALKCLAAAAKKLSGVRIVLSEHLDYARLINQIFEEPNFKDLRHSRLAYESSVYGSNEAKVTPLMDDVLKYAYLDLITSLSLEESAHPILISTGIVEMIDLLLSSDDVMSKISITSCCYGLSSSVEGRRALAQSDVFKQLYELVYTGEYPLRIPYFMRNAVYEAKVCLQRLILSQTAIDLLLDRDEDFLRNIPSEHKEELLKFFVPKSEKRWMVPSREIEKFMVGIGAAVVWSSLRFFGKQLLQRQVFSTKKYIWTVADSVTGTISLQGMFWVLMSLNDHVISKSKDLHYVAYTSAAFIGSVGFLAYIIKTFPYSFVPAIIGHSTDTFQKLRYQYHLAQNRARNNPKNDS